MGPPTKLTAYFGVPSTVNNRYDVTYAGQLFSRFDFTIFGPGLVSPGHPNYAATLEVLALMRQLNPSIKFFGTVDIQGSSPAPAPSLADQKANVDQWKAAGADGIFCRYSGYDRGTTRQGQNDIVDYIHSKGMTVVVASRQASDTLGNEAVTPGNPNGLPTHITGGDIYMMESWVIDDDLYPATDGYAGMPSSKARADEAVAYRRSLGIKVFGLSTADYNKYTDAQICSMEQVCEGMGLMWALDGYGLADAGYATRCNMSRPARSFGPLPASAVTERPYYANPSQVELERPDLGLTVHIDTVSHQYFYRNENAGCGQ